MASDFTHVAIGFFVFMGIFIIVMARAIYKNLRGDRSLYYHSEIPKTERRKDLSTGTHGKLRREWAVIDERSKDARIRGLIRGIAEHHAFSRRTTKRLERRAVRNTRRGKRARNRLVNRDRLVFTEVNLLQRKLAAGESGNRAAGHLNSKGEATGGIRRARPAKKPLYVPKSKRNEKKK